MNSGLADWKWLCSRQNRRYLEHVQSLANTLMVLYKDQPIDYEIKDWDNLLSNQLKEEKFELLYQQLVEGITLLNNPYRTRTNHGWQVEKTDKVLALRLLQPLIKPETMIGARSRSFYTAILLHFYPNNFTINQVVKTQRLSSSTVHRHIIILEKGGYIERVGGNKKQGYQYNLGHRSIY